MPTAIDPKTGRIQPTKLTPDQVAEIKSSPERGVILAARFKVSPQIISGIKNGRVWKSVQVPVKEWKPEVAVTIPENITDPEERRRFWAAEYYRQRKIQTPEKHALISQRGAEWRRQYRNKRKSEIKAYMLKWRKEHRAEINAYKRQEYSKNPTATKALNKRSYEKDKAKRAVSGKQYRLDHADQCKARQKQYLETHREEFNERRRAWRERTRDRRLEVDRLYRENNKEKVKASQDIGTQRRRARLKGCTTDISASRFYKWVRHQKWVACYYCGERVSGLEAHVDHIIPLDKGGPHSESNLCAACEKCNLRKHTKLPSELPFLDQPLLNL